MSESTKRTLLIAVVLVAIGCVVMGATMLLGERPSDGDSGDFNLSFGLSSSVTFEKNSQLKNEYSSGGEYSAPAENVNGLDVSWLAGSLNVVPYDGDLIEFSETSDMEIDEEVALRYGVIDGTLYIQYCSSGSYSNLPGKSLELKVPRSLAASLDDLELDGTSATINIRDFQVNDLEADTISGEVTITDCVARSLDVSSTSGNVRLENIMADECTVDGISSLVELSGGFGYLEVDTTSGDIRSIGGVTAERLEIDTISGRTELSGSFSDVELGSTSGGLHLDSDTVLTRFYSDSISGSITLTLPEDSSFNLSFDSVSGEIECEFPMSIQKNNYMVGDGAARFSVSTTSGDLTIYVA